MNKNVKRILAVLGCLCIIPPAVGSCATALTAHAEDETTGKEVIDSTRYSPTGWNRVQNIIDAIVGISEGEIYPNDLYDDIYINKFPNIVERQHVQEFIEDANRTYSSTQTYTIPSSFACLCKRELVYPYGDMRETDYLYIYQQGNGVNSVPQQFGEYTITANSMLLIRDTNFMGVTASSFRLDSTLYIGGGSPYNIIIRTPPNEHLYYDTPEGTQLEYVYFAVNNGSFSIPIVNNSVNTVRNDWLQRAYQTNQSEYETYIGTGGAILDDFEVLLGTGYDNVATGRWNRTMCQSGTTDYTVQPWYVTCAYFNNNTSTNFINTYFNTDPNNINPSKPPAYVMPDTNPLADGKVIDNSTVNNYYDYGITYDNTTNSLDLDPTVLAGALAGLIDPAFQGVLDGTFNAQPQIGMEFDTPLTLNLPDLVGDYLSSITVYPPSERPQVPIVTTLSEWDMLPTYTTETFPVSVQDGYDTLSLHTTDITDAIGVTGVFLLLALIGLMIYAVF